MLMARMGVPLVQAKEKWNCMDANIKAQFSKSLPEIAKTFGLNEVIYTSFVFVRCTSSHHRHYNIVLLYYYIIMAIHYSSMLMSKHTHTIYINIKYSKRDSNLGYRLLTKYTSYQGNKASLHADYLFIYLLLFFCSLAHICCVVL